MAQSVPAHKLHPHPARGTGDLPEDLQQPVALGLERWGPAETLLVIPKQVLLGEWGHPRDIPEQVLVFTATGLFHVQAPARAGEDAGLTYLRGDDLLRVRLQLVLLYGRLELTGVSDGRLATLAVEYNTVGHALLQPALHRLRAMAWAPGPAPDAPLLPAAASHWAALPLKLRNGLYGYALHPADRLLGYVLQPSIRGPRRSPVCPDTLLALTDREVLVVEGHRLLRRPNHGWTFTFLPRARVAATSADAPTGVCSLALRLAKDAVELEHHLTMRWETACAWQCLWWQHAG